MHFKAPSQSQGIQAWHPAWRTLSWCHRELLAFSSLLAASHPSSPGTVSSLSGIDSVISVLPVMATTILCVWVAHTTLVSPEVASFDTEPPVVLPTLFPETDPKSNPEKTPDPKFSLEKAHVSEFNPKRVPVAESIPERVPVPEFSPERAPDPKFVSENVSILDQNPVQPECELFNQVSANAFDFELTAYPVTITDFGYGMSTSPVPVNGPDFEPSVCRDSAVKSEILICLLSVSFYAPNFEQLVNPVSVSEFVLDLDVCPILSKVSEYGQSACPGYPNMSSY